MKPAATMTLAAVSLPYYRYILPYGLQKFKRFAINVWDVDPAGKMDEQVARLCDSGEIERVICEELDGAANAVEELLK